MWMGSIMEHIMTLGMASEMDLLRMMCKVE
jgi:hypothetical protein